MKRTKVPLENICPFTLEPVKNCSIGKLVFRKKHCPFSLESCWSERPANVVLESKSKMGKKIDPLIDKSFLLEN